MWCPKCGVHLTQFTIAEKNAAVVKERRIEYQTTWKSKNGGKTNWLISSRMLFRTQSEYHLMRSNQRNRQEHTYMAKSVKLLPAVIARFKLVE
jgi:Zn-dependent M28 family amino/carboxypeptidase